MRMARAAERRGRPVEDRHVRRGAKRVCAPRTKFRPAAPACPRDSARQRSELGAELTSERSLDVARRAWHSVRDPGAAGELLESIDQTCGDGRIAARSNRDRPGPARNDEIQATRADPVAGFRPGLGVDAREDALERRAVGLEET